MSKYIDLRKDVINGNNQDEEFDFQNEEARIQLDSDINATKKEIAVVTRNLKAAKSAYPFNGQAIISLQEDLAGYEEGLKRLEALKEELF